MRHQLLKNLFLIAVLISLSGMLGQNVAAQLNEQPPGGISEEDWQQTRLMGGIAQGMAPPSISLMLIDSEARKSWGITQEQTDKLEKKLTEMMQPLGEELEKKYGNFEKLSLEKANEVAKDYSQMLKKVNEMSQTLMKETFSEETIQQFNKYNFQQLGGTYGGALSVDNLATLHLTDEQKEKANAIVEKLNKERLPLIFQMEGTELNKEVLDKIVSLTIRGQKEIEALLTPEQMKLAKEIMAETPDKLRFMSDYLKTRPWRLDESTWKPGDGAPTDLENYPREMRKQRDR
ncbi:MAG: hypothetical protein LBJ67_04130, partial [Planctomycetaceae bacterium]|nr:hypothetical protein [Planctomycetaceae bacterium]